MDGKKKLEELVARANEAEKHHFRQDYTCVNFTDIRSISDAYKAMEAECERLRDALDDMLIEYGDKYDSECRLKNSSELDMIAKARAAMEGSRHEG